MTGVALEAEAGNADVIREKEGVASGSGVAAGEVGGISAVEILIWIWFEGDGVYEIAIGVHVVGGDRGVPHQSGKGDVKMRKICAVTAPVEWIKTVEPAKGLSGHRTFHGMIDCVADCVAEQGIGGFVCLHLASGIAEIPGDEVHFGVDVASCAGHGAIAGEFGVVEKTATLFDGVGSWIVTADGNFFKDGVGGGIDDGDGVGDAVEDIEAIGGGVKRETTRAAFVARVGNGANFRTDFDTGKDGAIGREFGDAIAAEGGEIEKVSGRVENDGGRLGKGVSFGGQIGKNGVVDVRI